MTLEQAYEYCRLTARTHAKSFYFSAQFLPRHKRDAIYAVYALCRHVDDAVDELSEPTETAGCRAVAHWQAELNRVYANEPAVLDDVSPVMRAWRDMLSRYPIPQNLPLELMRGVLMDTHINRYATWEDLKLYCYRVASTVGLMVTEIFGYQKAETLHYAEALGYAMQLTNILRDIGEDARLGRIYLPQEDMRDFGYTEAALMHGEINDAFRRLMKFEIERARTFYRQAEQGIPLLDRDARFTVLLAARLYSRILERIEAADYDVFAHRAHTTFAGKLRSVPRIWHEARRL
ncbi:MAG: phytoene/squalene synthase family protein [Pyrinomonadaceae bacterium MAG19_C2-C3]|nr:phytoene/squalene synthase family protein [Pyrinomonadaceae bacterium MAG19_C2-C3]